MFTLYQNRICLAVKKGSKALLKIFGSVSFGRKHLERLGFENSIYSNCLKLMADTDH